MEPEATAKAPDIHDAIQQIRLGNTDGGLALLEATTGDDLTKNLAKAEVAYWRDDYKNAMYYDERALASDYNWTDPLAVTHHLRAYVYAAQSTSSISRAKEFLDYYISQKRKLYDTVGLRPFNNVYQNAMHRLDGLATNDEPDEIQIYNEGNAPSKFIFYGEPQVEIAESLSRIIVRMWNQVPTMPILDLYEKYADNIPLDVNHIMAARTYLKIGDEEHFEKAIVRLVSRWSPSDKFEVMPMKLFVFRDIISKMTTSLKQRLLAMSKQ